VIHTDLHLADGDWAAFAGLMKRPVVLGHEVVGRVVEKGRAVSELAAGDRVGVPWVYWSCGTCEPCKMGRENLCAARAITGVTVDGGYAEFLKAKASHALKVPQNLTPAEAAPLFCAGVTVHRAIKLAGLRAGDRLAVFGVGGLGHFAVQVAKAAGAEVLAIDVGEEKLALARACGADQTYNAMSAELVGQLRATGGVHVALVTAAAKKAYDLAFGSLRPAGTLVVVGLPAEDLSFNPTLLTAGECRIVSSAVGTRQDLREVLEMAAAGKLRSRVETKPLAQINAVLELMRRGQITGRTVVTP
jgi:propanol-preferring alcohol dehydrogenase